MADTTLTVILLHGLPEAELTDQCLQLEKLRIAVAALPGVAVECLHWAETASERTILLQAVRGGLGRHFSHLLEERLAMRDGPIALVGYSAGGWILLSWAEEAEPSVKQSIAHLFLIAAPTHNADEFQRLPTRKEVLPVRPWSIAHDRALAGFEAGTQHVLFSLTDEVVPPHRAIFPHVLDALPSGARFLPLADVSYQDIRRDPAVVAYICSTLAQGDSVIAGT